MEPNENTAPIQSETPASRIEKLAKTIPSTLDLQEKHRQGVVLCGQMVAALLCEILDEKAKEACLESDPQIIGDISRIKRAMSKACKEGLDPGKTLAMCVRLGAPEPHGRFVSIGGDGPLSRRTVSICAETCLLTGIETERPARGPSP